MPKPFSRKAEKQALVDTPDRELKARYPDHPCRKLIALKKEFVAAGFQKTRTKAHDKPLPEALDNEVLRAKLSQTPDRALTTEFPDYPYRALHRWKQSLQDERQANIKAFMEGKLSDHQAALWVSKAELNRRKKQEYNEAMGLVGDILSGQKVDEPDAAEKAATYLTKLSDDENAWLTQRNARSVSISAARELLMWRHIEARIRVVAPQIAARPRGYARKKGVMPGPGRVLNMLWTDHHNGADLPRDELPVGYDRDAQRRRFASVLKNALDYKRDYRKDTVAHVYDAGDNLEGFLAHDMRSGEPLADQFATTLEYRIQATEHLAAEFPEVHIWVKPGNHDRNKMRHPGRATYQKWDSFQTMLGHAWAAACRNLPNVHFHVDKRPYAAVDSFGWKTFVTHGDTNFSVGNPGKTVRVNDIAHQMADINATQRYGCRFDVFAVGHVHTSVNMRIGGAELFINASLCPSSGYSDSLGYYTDCSQWLWETTEKYAVGDIRRVSVDTDTDTDASLDAIITPVNIWPED